MKYTNAFFVSAALSLSVLFLTGCSTFIGEKLLPMKTGLGVKEVYKADEDIEGKDPIPLTNLTLDTKATYSFAISSVRAALQDNIWIYVFKNDKLLYWGYPYQFNRHADGEIRGVGELATKYLVEKGYLKSTNE